MKWESYEISLWTHQETYLATLCNSQNFQKYDANAPVLNCDTTGTIEFTFSVPVVAYNLQTGKLENNSIWYNSLKNSASLANEKRVKLIFDKDKPDRRRIMELVITSLEQSRNGEQLYCQVTCAGLAFKWLGKIGFSLTLDSDTMLLEEEQKDVQLIPTINYWLDKIFPRDTNGKWLSFWRYKIDMKYNGHVGNRRADKVYENDDIVSWKEEPDGTLTQVYNKQPIEKQRFIKVQESNKYNITQDIAQEFQVFARYQFLYEDPNNPFKATAGIVIFYNEETQFTEYVISYGNNQTGLTKTSESSDIVTKMYVNPVQDQYSDNGFVALSQADANKMGEEYLFNFDYYISSGQMTSIQQKAIGDFQRQVRKINQQLTLASNGRNQIDNKLIEDKAEMNNAKDSRDSYTDLIRQYNDKISTIQNQMTQDVSALEQKVSLMAREESPTQYYIVFTRNGIDRTSLQSQTQGFYISNCTIETDQYGYVTKLKFSNKPANLITVKYNYDILGFYRRSISYYTSMRDSTSSKYQRYRALIGQETDAQNSNGTYYAQYNYWKNRYQTLAQQKRKLILKFEQVMGYFIKQGKWDASNFSVSYQNKTISSSSFMSPGFNPTGFYPSEKGSQTKSYYTVGSSQTRVYYDYIELEEAICKNITDYSTFYISEHWIDIAGRPQVNYYYNGAQGSIQFLKIKYDNNNTWVIPIFLLENADRSIDTTRSSFVLKYHYDSQDEGRIIPVQKYHRVASAGLANDKNVNPSLTLKANGVTRTCSAAGEIVYRRTPIDDDNIADTSIQIHSNQGRQIKQFDDFLFYKINQVKTITYKINNSIPIYLDSTVLPFKIDYKKDHSSQQLYFDAKDVLKTSAFPQVTYEVSFSYITQSKFLPSNDIKIYNDDIDLNLGNIVRINDWDLGLKNVKGIVTAFSLDLDSPQNTSFTISNYKTRFQDLFGRIVAQTQSMQSKAASYERAASAVSPNGEIVASLLQSTISNNSLIFSSGYNSAVSWDQNGIVVQNTLAYANGVKGQVIIKGGGILLSNALDADGNRIYTSAITPNGINATALTIGRLDTEKINIYSGDQIRFMWNAEGLFAYADDKVDKQHGYITSYIRYNQDGLYFYENSIPTVSLGWDGLYIGAQNGSVELDGAKGLTMYNGPKYDTNGEQNTERVVLLHLGRYDNDTRAISYGFRLFNNDGDPTLTTDNDGNLWLRETLSVGNGYSMSGITAVQQTQYNQDGTVKFSPVRFWAGANFEKRLSAPFWILQDGTMHATNAYIQGQIHATSGEFKGQITAQSGTIGGWTISDNKLSASPDSPAVIQFVDKNGNISSLGSEGVNITGQIHATSGEFTGTINASGGTIGNLSIYDINQAAGMYFGDVGSSAGFTITNAKKLNTVLTADIKNGVFTQNGAQYSCQWYVSENSEQWKTLTEETSNEITVQLEIDKELYIKYIATHKTKPQIIINSNIAHFINIVTSRDGADAVSVLITSSLGAYFRNDTGITTLTARIFSGGAEVDLDGTDYTYLWHKIDSSVPLGTNKTIQISAKDVSFSQTYMCDITKA